MIQLKLRARRKSPKDKLFWCYGLTPSIVIPTLSATAHIHVRNVLLMTIVPITFRPLHSFCCAIAENMKEKKKKRPCSIKSKDNVNEISMVLQSWSMCCSASIFGRKLKKVDNNGSLQFSVFDSFFPSRLWKKR